MVVGRPGFHEFLFCESYHVGYAQAMRTLFTALATMLILSLSAFGADTGKQSGVSGKLETTQPEKIPDQAAETNRLDELFAILGRETNNAKAGRIARSIWREWGSSGSDSVDLLMTRAASSMSARKYSQALDILDQVVVLAPDYAEGWNRRATAYFVVKEYGKSITDIRRVLRLEPRHFGALAGLGMIFQLLEQEELALQTWYHVLKIYPALDNAQRAVIELEEVLAGRRT